MPNLLSVGRSQRGDGLAGPDWLKCFEPVAGLLRPEQPSPVAIWQALRVEVGNAMP